MDLSRPYNLIRSALEVARAARRVKLLGPRTGAVRPRSQVEGFTLVEIMVVVAIIAVIATAAIPSLYGFVHKQGFQKTLSNLMEACRSARAEAIIHDQTAELVFHPHDLTAEAGGNGGYGAWAHSVKFENCTIQMLDVDLKEFKDADSVSVKFYPNGRSQEMVLVLQSDKNEWRTITLESTTGLPIMTVGLPQLSK